jgi:hypothetical protein
MLIHAATDQELHPAVSGGAQRTFGLLRGLARAHDVRALCVVPNRAPGPGEERVDGVTLLRRRAWYTSAVWRLERAHLAPMFLAADLHAAGAPRFARMLGGGADVLLADINLAGMLPHAAGALRVYASQNVEYDHARDAGATVLAAKAWAGHRGGQERRAIEHAELVIACTSEDAVRMAALYGVPEDAIAVVPNGWDETRVRPATAEERDRARAALGIAPQEYVAVFLASGVPHNERAARALVERVLPGLAGSGVRLVLAGGVARVLRHLRAPGLLLVPPAPDLGAVLHAADAGLNPAEAGGGSNVKLPAYLAAGLAAVTTPFGLRGYAALQPHVTSVPLTSFADVLRAHPRGWLARGESLPPEVAAHAWGRLGEQLGRELVRRVGAPGQVTVDAPAAAGGMR